MTSAGRMHSPSQQGNQGRRSMKQQRVPIASTMERQRVVKAAAQLLSQYGPGLQPIKWCPTHASRFYLTAQTILESTSTYKNDQKEKLEKWTEVIKICFIWKEIQVISSTENVKCQEKLRITTCDFHLCGWQRGEGHPYCEEAELRCCVKFWEPGELSVNISQTLMCTWTLQFHSQELGTSLTITKAGPTS